MRKQSPGILSYYIPSLQIFGRIWIAQIGGTEEKGKQFGGDACQEGRPARAMFTSELINFSVGERHHIRSSCLSRRYAESMHGLILWTSGLTLVGAIVSSSSLKLQALRSMFYEGCGQGQLRLLWLHHYRTNEAQGLTEAIAAAQQGGRRTGRSTSVHRGGPTI